MMKLTNILQEIQFEKFNIDNEFKELAIKFGEFDEFNVTTHLTDEIIGRNFNNLFLFLKKQKNNEYRIELEERTAVFYIGRNNEIVLEIL